MNELVLRTTEMFGEVETNIYENENHEMFMTARQLGECLGYADKKGIDNLIARHSHLKNEDFSVMSRVVCTDGKRYNTRMFSYKGILSIINYSSVSAARKSEFLNWVNEVSGKQLFAIVDARKELYFLDKLEPFLKVFNITGARQYKILDYRIDFYISSLNIAVEYDETAHQYYTYEQQELRQKLIENALHCRFIRLSDKDTDEINLAKVIKEIYDIKEF